MQPCVNPLRVLPSTPSFDLGFSSEDGNQRGLDAPLGGEDLERSFLTKYTDNLLATEDLDQIFDALDLHDAPEPTLAPILSQGPLLERPPAAIDGRTTFLPRDLAFQQALDAGGCNPSINVDNWALNRLRKFREFINADLTVDLVDMEPSVASILLCKFFERARKENGGLYPPPSLMPLLRAFNRIFCKSQEARVLRTSLDEPLFRMKESPLFRRVCIACVLAMTRSKDAGLGVKRKKAAVVSVKDEKTVLESSFMAKMNSRGLLRRTAHYCLFRFGIRGGSKLRSLKALDFTIGSDDAGRFVQYDERVSKNYKVTMAKFQTEHFCAAVKCHELDVVDTFELYMRRRPEGMNEMFLAPIDTPRTHIWYAKLVVGARQLSTIVKQSLQEAGISNEASSSSVSNKSGRATLITRMAESGVPSKVGMLISGHKSESAYGRYDQSAETRVRATQRCAEGSSVYSEALQDENKNMKTLVIEGKEKENECKRLRTTYEPASERGQRGLLKVPVPPQEVAESEKFAASYDWDADGKVYLKGKAQVVVNNPVSTLFGNLTNCSLHVTFAGPLNFSGHGPQ